MSTQLPVDDGLKSRRYVTSGYRNVFHRSFLYGLGLSRSDMEKPFAGLALAHNESVPGHGLVRALGDASKRTLAASGITEREFVVPESRYDPAEGVVARELVADSAELVVRGHWYDALVGVAASVTGAAGLAEAVARLRIPGLVVVPEERRGADDALDRYVALLEALGLGLSVSLDELQVLQAASDGLRHEIAGTAGVTLAADKLRSGVPARGGLATGEVLPHVAALAHELGLVSALELVGDDDNPFALRHVQLRAGSVTVDALVDSGPAVSHAQLRVGADGVHVVLGDGAERSVVTGTHVARGVSGPLVVVDTDEDLQALVTVGCAEISLEPGPPAPGAPRERFAVATIAGVSHPGFVVGPLSYDRL